MHSVILLISHSKVLSLITFVERSPKCRFWDGRNFERELDKTFNFRSKISLDTHLSVVGGKSLGQHAGGEAEAHEHCLERRRRRRRLHCQIARTVV